MSNIFTYDRANPFGLPDPRDYDFTNVQQIQPQPANLFPPCCYHRLRQQLEFDAENEEYVEEESGDE